MREFITDTFLLRTGSARRLYQDFARDSRSSTTMPSPVADIETNRGFDNLTQAWLAGDHL